MNILFVCRHNRFRSKVAEAYFKKINKNKNIRVKSAGVFIGKYPLDKNQVKIAKEFGVKISGKPKGITTDMLRWQDLIIIVTNDIPPSFFNYAQYKYKTLAWKIKDVESGKDVQGDKRIVRQIIKKVNALNKKLKSKK